MSAADRAVAERKQQGLPPLVSDLAALAAVVDVLKPSAAALTLPNARSTVGPRGGWLSDKMPLRVSDERCAVLMRTGTTQWASHCSGVAVIEVRWQFHDGVKLLRLCADHADVLTRRERCLQVRPLELSGRRYAADGEG